MHRTQVFEVFNQHAMVPEQQRVAGTSRPADVCGSKGQQACGAGGGERRGGGDERARRRSSWEVALAELALTWAWARLRAAFGAQTSEVTLQPHRCTPRRRPALCCAPRLPCRSLAAVGGVRAAWGLTAGSRRFSRAIKLAAGCKVVGVR